MRDVEGKVFESEIVGLDYDGGHAGRGRLEPDGQKRDFESRLAPGEFEGVEGGVHDADIRARGSLAFEAGSNARNIQGALRYP